MTYVNNLYMAGPNQMAAANDNIANWWYRNLLPRIYTVGCYGCYVRRSAWIFLTPELYRASDTAHAHNPHYSWAALPFDMYTHVKSFLCISDGISFSAAVTAHPPGSCLDLRPQQWLWDCMQLERLRIMKALCCISINARGIYLEYATRRGYGLLH